VVTWRVSSPQSQSVWSAYDTPGDLIRVALGLVLCLWMTSQLFKLPNDADGYRTWVYLGSVVVPLALIFAIAAW
jgi:hypothetical protein